MRAAKQSLATQPQIVLSEDSFLGGSMPKPKAAPTEELPEPGIMIALVGK